MPNLVLLIQKDLLQFKNYFVDIRNNPKRILIFVFYIAYAVFMIWANGLNGKEEGPMPVQMVNTFAFGLMFMMLIMNVGTSKKELFTLFKPADLSISFTAPIAPRILFVSALIKSMYSNFFVILIVLFFLSGRMISSGASLFQIIIGGLGLLALFFFMQPLTFISARIKEKISILASQSLMMAFVVLPTFYVFYRSDFNLISMLNNDMLNWVPLVGWSKALLLLCYNYQVEGIYLIGLLYFASLVLILGTCLYLADDYYEDVYEGTLNMTKLRRRQKEGKNLKGGFKIFESKRVTLETKENGHHAYYWKEKVIKLKSDLHYLVGIYEIVVVLAAVGVVIYNRITGGEHYWFAYILNGVFAYLLLILSASNKSEDDFLTARYLMIPEKNSLKLFSLHRLSITRLVLTVLIFNLVLVFTKGVEPIVLLIMAGLQVLIYMMLLYSNIFVKVFFQNQTDAAVVMPFIKIVQLLLVLLPSGIVAGFVGATTESVFWTVLSVFGINAVFASIFVACTGLLAKRIEI